MSDDTRLTDLEIKVAYLEKLVDELDGVVREQTTRIDRLVEDLRRAQPAEGSVSSEKPPHY